ncbi:MAG: hypothetical protein Q8S31_06985 [Alphaproteobacteria bacterium]|nr:hypothetical protein [Alphaproteobacteria bacterium]
MINRFGAENPRVQALLLLYARDGALKTYVNLLLKPKDPFVHPPSLFDIKPDTENEQVLHFAANPEIFNYLPANKFGDQLSTTSMEGLIQKLKANDVNERGDLLTFQNQIRDFVKSENFIALLSNFDVEEGAKLRELMRGYVSNT